MAAAAAKAGVPPRRSGRAGVAAATAAIAEAQGRERAPLLADGRVSESRYVRYIPVCAVIGTL